jgi:pyruvate dehydrogenase E1 component alpha subunit
MLARARAFGIAGETLDGQNVRDVHAAALRHVDRARRGAGPGFLLCSTYRFHGHHVGDIDRAYYRSKAEEEEWKTKRDPIQLLGKWLTKNRLSGDAALRALDNEVFAEIQAAVKFALEAKYPEHGEVGQHVYA